MGPSKVALPKALKGRTVVLEIAKAKKGKRYPDLVISELRFWDKNGPFSVATTDAPARQKALLGKVKGKALGDFVDRQWVGFCDEGPSHGASLKVRSNSSFVFYSNSERDWGEREDQQVFEGAWVISQNEAKVGKIKLYGRKHLIATTWRPYQGKTERETTKVAGGTVLLTPVKALGFAGLTEHVSPWPLGEAGPSCDRLNELTETGYDELVAREAFVLEGKAIIGVFWRER